jgi:hypothetical protein
MKLSFLKKKKFWLGVAGVATGAAYIVNGDFAAGINTIVQSIF